MTSPFPIRPPAPRRCGGRPDAKVPLPATGVGADFNGSDAGGGKTRMATGQSRQHPIYGRAQRLETLPAKGVGAPFGELDDGAARQGIPSVSRFSLRSVHVDEHERSSFDVAAKVVAWSASNV